MSIARGLADPVFDAQRTFRALMTALARPGSIAPLFGDLDPPKPLTPELAMAALTLCDHEASLWLDASLARAEGVADYLRFHTGAAVVADAGGAAFALVAEPSALPPLASFCQGSQEYPDRSTTLVIAVERLSQRHGLVLQGPGILDWSVLGIEPMPPRFEDQLRDNRAIFPRGVDLVFIADGKVAALPRSTAIVGRR